MKIIHYEQYDRKSQGAEGNVSQVNFFITELA